MNRRVPWSIRRLLLLRYEDLGLGLYMHESWEAGAIPMGEVVVDVVNVVRAGCHL